MNIIDIHRVRKVLEQLLRTEISKGPDEVDNEEVEELIKGLEPLWAHIQAYNNIIKSKNRIFYKSKINLNK